jgi:hypothetical protein
MLLLFDADVPQLIAATALDSAAAAPLLLPALPSAATESQVVAEGAEESWPVKLTGC